MQAPKCSGVPIFTTNLSPSAVIRRYGVVLTANYIAKPFGVKTGMAIWQSREKCSDLVVLPSDYREYIRFGCMAREIYEDYADQVEPFGLDESWLDVTGSVGLFGSPMRIAAEISERFRSSRELIQRTPTTIHSAGYFAGG